MTDKDTARAQIATLVEKFDRTPKKDIAGYTEQQMRVSFILPFFQALGWDTTNPAEMSAEENISRGFVDFGFYLHGVPVFYLETKRAREDINRPEFMKQAINYAYLKGVTWAVLTDFDEMMVFNAEWEDDDPEKTRLFHLRHADYAGSSFDDLWLLSKDAMGAREIDRLAERVGRKAKREPVTSILFKQLTDWRFRLFQNITTMKTTLWATDPHEVDNAVQKLIDRLIFIRSMEDRGIEEARLQPLLRQKRRGDYFAELQKLFRELDGIYNSNLFAQSNLDYMELHDPDLVREIIDGLYIIEKGQMARYDFNAIDADVLGAVYEQYLGFKALDPQGKSKLDPRKREKRKAQGIYYTPKFVVRYIVQATLGRKLAEGADARTLRILDPACGSGSFLIEAFDVLDRHLATIEPTEDAQGIAERRQRILRDNLFGVDLDDQAVEVTRLNLALRAAYTRDKLPYLTNIKHGNSLIDDPAVAGATAFRWEERFPTIMGGETRPLFFVTFVTHNSRVSERMVEFGVQVGEPFVLHGEDMLLMAEKIAEAIEKYRVPVVTWNILPDHVHMIVGARDVASLDEYVRKIKGYSSYAFARARDLEKGGHIWGQKYNHWTITDSAMLTNVYEYVRNNHEKHAETWGDALRKWWAEGMPDKGQSHEQNKGLKPLVRTIDEVCISPEDAAHEPGGFDVVIGNPPYVRQESLGEAFKRYAEKHYDTYAGTADLYQYFIERSIKLLRPDGIYGVIVANKWMRANYGKPLRAWLKAQRLEEIIDFGDLPVFPEATTYPCIIVARPTNGATEGDSFAVTQVKTLDFPTLESYAAQHRYSAQRASLNDAGWSLAGDAEAALMDKLRAAGKSLGEYVDGAIYYGIKTGLNEAFVIDDVTRKHLIAQDARSAELIKPFLMGRDVKRYETPRAEHHLILIPNGWTTGQMKLDKDADATDTHAPRTRGLSPLSDSSSERDSSSDHASAPLSEHNATVAVSESGAWAWLAAHYPAIAGYLSAFADKARRRWDKGQYWWELRPCDYYDKFERPKLIYPDLGNRGQFLLDQNESNYLGNTGYFLGSSDKYLLGILNSQLITYVSGEGFSNYRGGYIRFFQQYVEQLPIRTINFDDPADKARHDKMVALVETMLRLKREHAAEAQVFSDKRHEIAHEIERTDAQIDALVYELYGLTDEEIALVEGRG